MSNLLKTILIVIFLSTLVACGNKIGDRYTSSNSQENDANVTEPHTVKPLPEYNINEPVPETRDSLSNNHLISLDEVMGKEYTDYEDPDPFAIFISDFLYELYNSNITVEQYATFLKNHGSFELIKDLDFEENLDTVHDILQTIISNIEQANTEFIDHETSVVEIDDNRGNFFRKMTTKDGKDILYKTSIVYENGMWKFLDDQTNPHIDINEFQTIDN